MYGGKIEETERPKMRFIYAVRKDMAVAEVTEEETEDRIKGRWKIHCGDR